MLNTAKGKFFKIFATKVALDIKYLWGLVRKLLPLGISCRFIKENVKITDESSRYDDLIKKIEGYMYEAAKKLGN